MLRIIILATFMVNLAYVLTDISSSETSSSETTNITDVSSESSSYDQCGKNQVYDLCPSSCPPRTCETKNIAYDCGVPLKPGDPKCPRPKCQCADGYFDIGNGKCVMKEECPTETCGSNEYYDPCPVPTCANQTCKNIDKRFNCPRIPSNYTCVGECRCKTGYYRNIINECISKADCKKCPGKHEYFSCGNACNNECDKLSIQNHYKCPYVNIMCNKMCYCEDGYARNAKNSCIPITQCPPQPCGKNQVYDFCPSSCPPRTCATKDVAFKCKAPLKPGDPKCLLAKCRCAEGFYDTGNGKCVTKEQCPTACKLNEVPDDCATNICLPTCAEPAKNTYCKPNPANCKSGCVCAKGYLRDQEGVCVLKEKCPSTEEPS